VLGLDWFLCVCVFKGLVCIFVFLCRFRSLWISLGLVFFSRYVRSTGPWLEMR